MNMLIGALLGATKPTNRPAQGPTKSGAALDAVTKRQNLVHQARQIVDPKRQASALKAEKEAHQHRLAIAAKREKLASEISNKSKSTDRKQVVKRIDSESSSYAKDQEAARKIAEYRKLAHEISELDRAAKKRNEQLSMAQIDQVKIRLEKMNRLVPEEAKAKDGFYSELARKDIIASKDKNGEVSVDTARKIKRNSSLEVQKVSKRLKSINPRQQALESIADDLDSSKADVVAPHDAPSALKNHKFIHWVSGKIQGGADQAKLTKLIAEYNAVASINGEKALGFNKDDFDNIAKQSGLSTTINARELTLSAGIVATKDANGFVVNAKAKVISALDSAEFAKFLRENANNNGLSSSGMSLAALNNEVSKFNLKNLNSVLVIDEKAKAQFARLAYAPQDEGGVHTINLGSLNRIDREIHYATRSVEDQQARQLKLIVAEAKSEHEKIVAAEVATRAENKGYVTWLFAQPAHLWHSAKDAMGISQLQHGRKVGYGAVVDRLKDSQKAIDDLEASVKVQDLAAIQKSYEATVKTRSEAIATIQKHDELITAGSKTGEIIAVSTAAVTLAVGTGGAGAPLSATMISATLFGAGIKGTLDLINTKSNGQTYTFDAFRQSIGEGGLAGFTSAAGGALASKATSFAPTVATKLGANSATSRVATNLAVNLTSDGLVGAGSIGVDGLVRGDTDNLAARMGSGFLSGIAWGGAFRGGSSAIKTSVEKIKEVAQNPNALRIAFAMKTNQLQGLKPVELEAAMLRNGGKYQVRSSTNVQTPDFSEVVVQNKAPKITTPEPQSAPIPDPVKPVTVPISNLDDLAINLRSKNLDVSESAVAEFLKSPQGQSRLVAELKSRQGLLNGQRGPVWDSVFNVLDDAPNTPLGIELMSTLRNHPNRSLLGRLSPRVNKRYNQILAEQQLSLEGLASPSRRDVRAVRALLRDQRTTSATQQALGEDIKNGGQLLTKFMKNPGGRGADKTARRVGMLKEMENVSLTTLSAKDQKAFLDVLDSTMKDVHKRSNRGAKAQEASNMVEALGQWYANTDDATRALLVKPLARVTRVWSMRNGPGAKAREILGQHAGDEVQKALALQLRKAKSPRERRSMIEALTSIGQKEGLTFAAFDELRVHKKLFNFETTRPIGDPKLSVRRSVNDVLKDDSIKIKVDLNNTDEILRLSSMLKDKRLAPIAIRSFKEIPAGSTVTQQIESRFVDARGIKLDKKSRFGIQTAALEFFNSLDDQALKQLSSSTRAEISRLKRVARNPDIKNLAEQVSVKIRKANNPSSAPAPEQEPVTA